MTTIQPVQSYRHPLSETPYPSEAAAEAAYQVALKEKAEADKEAARVARIDEDANYPRLNAKTFDQIVPLMQEACKRHGITLSLRLNVRFGEVSTYHSAPIGCSPTYGNPPSKTALGWSGRVQGSMSGGKRLGSRMGFSDLCGSWGGGSFALRGFHTGTGSYGPDDFGGEFLFYLDDFPHLKALYERSIAFAKEQIKHAAIVARAMDRTLAKTRKDKRVVTLRAEADSIKREIAKLDAEQAALTTRAGERIQAIAKIEAAAVEAAKPKLASAFSAQEQAAFAVFR